MESDAIVSRRGTDYSTENCPTSNTELLKPIPQMELSGVVGRAIPIVTSGPSLRLSVGERQRLERIRSDRERGFMVSAVDVDFLLEVIGRYE